MAQPGSFKSGIVREYPGEPDGSYFGGMDFVEPGGQYTGRFEVGFSADFPQLDPRVLLSTVVPGESDASAYASRRIPPGELREIAAAFVMCADACEKARQSKAA